MSVTELHRTADGWRPEERPGAQDVDGSAEHEVAPARQALSIAILIVDHLPDAMEVAHLYEDFEVVLIARDTEAATAMLRGIAGPAPTERRTPAPTHADVTPLFDDAPGRGRPGPQITGLTLDEEHHLATWQGRPLPLTSRERVILGCLLADPGRVWSYRQLFEGAWGGCYLGDPALVHSALKRVRRKMREAGVAVSIDAVRGVGFRADSTPG